MPLGHAAGALQKQEVWGNICEHNLGKTIGHGFLVSPGEECQLRQQHSSRNNCLLRSRTLNHK